MVVTWKRLVKLENLSQKRAKEKGYTEVVFDRGGYLYHGECKR